MTLDSLWTSLALDSLRTAQGGHRGGVSPRGIAAGIERCEDVVGACPGRDAQRGGLGQTGDGEGSAGPGCGSIHGDAAAGADKELVLTGGGEVKIG